MHPPTHCAGGFLRLCFVCLQSGLATVIKRFYVIFLVEYPGKTALVHVPALAGVHGHLRRVHRVLPAVVPLRGGMGGTYLATTGEAGRAVLHCRMEGALDTEAYLTIRCRE